jgi:pimeloyl-ACP methyl ester carboxylesterase
MTLMKELDGSSMMNKSFPFARLGELAEKADSFDPVPDLKSVPISQDGQALIYGKVWNEAEAMRRSWELLCLTDNIRCPVAAIHGDHDPHPAEGVRIPLSKRIKQFEWIQLEKCGHQPWIEKQAGDGLFETVKRQIK